MTSPASDYRRLARLQRECEVSIGPILLLAMACAVAIVVLWLGALLVGADPAQAAEPSRQTMPRPTEAQRGVP